jgi:hypothetical protein
MENGEGRDMEKGHTIGITRETTFQVRYEDGHSREETAPTM